MVRYRGLTRYYFAVWKQEWPAAFYIFAYLFGKFFSVAAAAAVAPTFAAAAPAAAAARAPAAGCEISSDSDDEVVWPEEREDVCATR